MKTFYIPSTSHPANSLLEFLNLILYLLVLHFGFDEVKKALKDTGANIIKEKRQ